MEEIHWLATGQSSCSLLDRHPPKIFQIDGNLGVISAATAMLAQTIDDVLYLLPALPDKWSCGKVTGLCTENALKLDIEWANSQVVRVEITAKYDCEVNIAPNSKLPYKLYKLTANTPHILE